MLALRPAALATRTARAARAIRAPGASRLARTPSVNARVRPGVGSPDRRAFVRCRASAAGPRVDNDVIVPGADHASLPKNFEHGDTEERLYQWWEERGCFVPDPNAVGEPFCIAMPPPNVTGALHMGHAMFVTLQDVMARVARMRGRPTLWLPGSDHAGIATQLVVERALEADGLTREGIGREAFEKRTWEWKEEYGGRIAGQIRRLGASCDWSRERFTLDDGLSDAVLESFIKLHDDGLIYKGTYMVNWAPKLQTAVSDLEVEYADEPGTLYYFRYPVAPLEDEDETELFLEVATSRPETILGDTAVAVNPTDERFQALIGRECVVPFTDPPRRVPIIGDEYVDVEFGTGALKVTPGHDPNDYEIGKRVGLETINVMNKDGTMNGVCGEAYESLDRFECRTKLWRDMETNGLAIKTEPYQTRVPRSQRGGEIIEPLVSEQWFCKMDTMAAPALAASESGELAIVPQRFEKIYRGWLTDIRDWCISRQLWWGHRIPVYYVHENAEALSAARSGTGKGSSPHYVVARDEAEAYAKARAADFGPTFDPQTLVLYQEEDVLDTWFSSGLWPFSTLGWPNSDAEDLARFFPTTVMETGHDILFFWVARMVMLSYGMTGKAPFKTVFLHGLVRDEQGRKMSKSLGNVVDPLGVIEAQGCDALRFTLATGTAAGQDLNLNMDRLASNRNFTNKIWNAGKFVLYALGEMSDDERVALVAEAEAIGHFDAEALHSNLPLPSAWIVSELRAVTDKVTAAHDRHDFGEAGRAAYAFFYDDFADWFIESAKARLYSDDEDEKRLTLAVALHALDQTLRLLHPFVPYVTEEVWRALPHRGETLMCQSWPRLGAPKHEPSVKRFELLRAVVRAIRNARAEYAVEPARRVPAVVVVADDADRAALERELATLGSLARLEMSDDGKTSAVAAAPPAAATENPASFVQQTVRDGVEVFLPLAGIVDPAKESARLQKQAAKLEKEIGSLAGRLGSPKFVEKAPEEVVRKSEKELAELRERLAAVAARLEQMKALADA